MASSTFLQNQVDVLEAKIANYNDAITALIVNGVSQYELDTGQNKQKVTRLDLPQLEKTLESLYNQYTTLCARLTGSGVMNMRPAW